MSPLLLILVAVLGVVAVAGRGFVFVGADAGQATAAKRVAAVSRPKEKGGRARLAPAEAAGMRRKQILENLKASEKESRKQRLSIEAKLRQAGLSVTVRQFWIVSGGIILAVAAAGLLFGFHPLLDLGLGFSAGEG